MLLVHFIDTCSLAVNAGPCKGAFPRWYYDAQSGNCKLFSYGGCHGNNNRFISKRECVNECGKYILVVY